MSRKTKKADLPPASASLSKGPCSGESSELTRGNLKPSDGTAIPVSALRSATKTWVEREIAQWSSVAFITLNFKSTLRSNAGQLVRLDEQTARNEVRKFGNRVDRAAYGNRLRRFNRRVCRIPFLEYGQDRGWHCHLAMEKPLGMADDRFVNILKDAWTASEWSSEPPDIRVADVSIAGYVTKYRSKSEMEAWPDTVIVEAVVVRTK
jgi:hypothetical protein